MSHKFAIYSLSWHNNFREAHLSCDSVHDGPPALILLSEQSTAVDALLPSTYNVFMSNRPGLVKQFYEAFSNGDREFGENLLAPNFTFSAPPDPFLDRAGFFKKCWPEGGNLKDIEYIRVIEHGDEVIVTHEYAKPDDARVVNTDIVTFAGDKVIRLEVYFGWDVEGQKL